MAPGCHFEELVRECFKDLPAPMQKSSAICCYRSRSAAAREQGSVMDSGCARLCKNRYGIRGRKGEVVVYPMHSVRQPSISYDNSSRKKFC